MVVSRASSERGLDAPVLADRQFLDQQVIEGFDRVDLALLDRRRVASSISRARGIRKRDEAVLDAVEGGRRGMGGHERSPVAVTLPLAS